MLKLRFRKSTMICLRWYYKYYYVTLMSIFFVLCLNIYLVFFFSKDETSLETPAIIKYNTTYFATQNIINSFNKLDKQYDLPIPNNESTILRELDLLISNLKLKINGDIDFFANTIKIMNKNGLMPLAGSPYLGSTINLLKTSEIVHTYNALKGTQLKLMLTFNNGQEVLFKPKWYSESEVIDGTAYAGKDRYNGEIVSFYVSLILGFPRVPIAAKRILDSTEIHRTASVGLRKTMYINATTKETCVYGKCYYCKREDPICTRSERLEGAVTFYLPSYLKITQHSHPWRRTYKHNVKARWENDYDYCDHVKANYDFERILDFVDMAIFDFIIGNGDRHLYEVVEQFNNTVLLIDNGKSFGNPYEDHMDILAPVYQCCAIRRNTWERLVSLKGGTFARTLQDMLDVHETVSMITRPHYRALERRVRLVYATIVTCQRESGGRSVFK